MVAPVADGARRTEEAVTETETEGRAEAEPPRRRPRPDDALERLLAEEEEIERRTREQHHEAPHFRKEVD